MRYSGGGRDRAHRCIVSKSMRKLRLSVALSKIHCRRNRASFCEYWFSTRSEAMHSNTYDCVQSAAFHPSIFGERLDHIMSQQMEAGLELSIPRILPFLAESIIALSGARTEGIFRLPGDFDSIGEMKARLDRGEYHLVSQRFAQRYKWIKLRAVRLTDWNRRSTCFDLAFETLVARA